MTHSGLGVTPRAANERLLTFDVPGVATNVDFRHSFYDSLIDAAEFTISERDFLIWMADEERVPTRFAVSEKGLEWADGAIQHRRDWIYVTPISSVLDANYEEVEIKNGYYFDDYDPRGADDSGLTVVYDSDRRRVYMWRTAF